MKTNIGTYGSINDNVPLWVNGVNTGKTLTYNKDGAEGAGLYYYEPVVSYDVRFFKDAGETEQIGETQSVVSGEKATAPAAPTKDGYTFTGWNPDTNAVIEAATDFVAQWSTDGYMITFDANGGTVDPASTNYTIASGTIVLPEPTGLTGVTFGGWTNETVTTPITEFTPTAQNVGSFTLYAKWTPSGNPQTIDQTSETPTATFAAESVEDAKTKVSLATPVGVDVEKFDAAEYKSNFDFTATSNGDGTYTVTLTGIKEEKVAAVEDSAVEAAVKALSKAEEATIAIPAGLYYRITPAADLGTWGTPATGCSNGSVDAPTYSTPAATVQKGFYKIELSTVPYEE